MLGKKRNFSLTSKGLFSQLFWCPLLMRFVEDLKQINHLVRQKYIYFLNKNKYIYFTYMNCAILKYLFQVWW